VSTAAPARRKQHVSAYCAMGDHDKCRSARCTCSHHAAAGDGPALGAEAQPADPPSPLPVEGPSDRLGPGDSSLRSLPLSALVPGRNPRRQLGDLEGLTASIRAVGIVEPLIVEPGPGPRFTVVAGHRRLAASKLAGLDEVPCLVRAPSDDKARLELAIIENLQRAELEPLDEAGGFRALVDLGLSQRAVAERVGCSQSHVSKRLGLLELPAAVRKRVEKGTLPLEAAAALLRLKDHPDKLKVVAGEDPSRIVWQVESAEKDIAWEAKAAELIDVAHDHGWQVVDPVDNVTKRPYKTIERTTYDPPQLELDAKAHEAEPCHGVVIPTRRGYSSDGPKATRVCVEPARHTPKGESALKARKPEAERRELTAHERRQAEDDKGRREATAARLAVLAEVLDGDRAKRAWGSRSATSPSVALCLHALIDRTALGADVAKAVADLLALAPDETSWGGKDFMSPLQRLAAEGDLGLHRVGLAVALAGREVQLRSQHHRWGGDADLRHFAFLEANGYQPTPWERARLAAAAKEHAAEASS
jgi:ParB/RepB/Spo0J family partition protein